MYYNDFKGTKLSRLGFGAMRLPMNASKEIDEATSAAMIDTAITSGVNYFDTAYSYINGNSELFLGRTLTKYPRESYNLATKFPGHEIAETFYPAPIFERQLRKCRTDYFDFYLMHNVYENSIGVYEDPKWDIINYFVKQKEQGKIRHLGFSTHGQLNTIKRFLDKFGSVMEFCQIQLNYLDWTLQDAEAKYNLLTEYGIPVWVMEPVRGGKLATLHPNEEAKMKELRPTESIASWAFRWLQRLPNVKMILSGMSSMEQVQDNIKTFSGGTPLNENEISILADIAEKLKNTVPCTGCRYCCKECPQQLDIPFLMKVYNDVCFTPSMTVAFMMDGLKEDKLPTACLACGKCAQVCPQKINVPEIMKKLAAQRELLPKWEQICKERREAQERTQK